MKYSRSKGEITPSKIVVDHKLLIVKCSLKSRTAKFVSDLRQVGGLLRILWLPTPKKIK
jgi:hypothetical protein